MFVSLRRANPRFVTGGIFAVLLMVLIGLKLGQPLAVSRLGGEVGTQDALSKMRVTLAQDRRLLAVYEQEQAKLRVEVIEKRKHFQEGRVSKERVQEAERAFIMALRRVHDLRRSVIEADIAVTEAVLGEKVNRLPALPVNGYRDTKDLVRFNGGSPWSLKEAPRVEKYFIQKFGRRLPVTARGQSETHNRLRFDHHDSMDVALHPDSVEGKALIDYLRKTHVPFIAFRGAVAGASTGPHIHIGKPSHRLASNNPF